MRFDKLRGIAAVIFIVFCGVTILMSFLIPLIFSPESSDLYNNAFSIFIKTFAGILGIILGNYVGKNVRKPEYVNKIFSIIIILSIILILIVGDCLIYWPALTGQSVKSIYSLMINYEYIISGILCAIVTYLFS